MLQGVIILAFAFLIAIELLRALPWPRGWAQKKPLSCDICMSSWGTIGCIYADPQRAGELMAAGGICLFLLVVFITPRRSPPEWE